MAKNAIEIDGIVEETFQDGTFKVKLDNGHKIIAHMSGKIMVYRISILPGDKVTVEVSPYDLTRGRITYRKKQVKGGNRESKIIS